MASQLFEFQSNKLLEGATNFNGRFSIYNHASGSQSIVNRRVDTSTVTMIENLAIGIGNVEGMLLRECCREPVERTSSRVHCREPVQRTSSRDCRREPVERTPLREHHWEPVERTSLRKRRWEPVERTLLRECRREHHRENLAGNVSIYKMIVHGVIAICCMVILHAL